MENKEIRFITPDYKELFRIPDDGSIVVTRPEGEEYIHKCKYLDQTHFEDSSHNYWHICQFAERQVQNGATVKPEIEPEINQGYRIIQRNYANDKIFKLGVNPKAAQKYVTWQSYRDNPTRYDFGHYWSERSDANTDLFRRTDAERMGRVYDYTKFIQQQKKRDKTR